MSFPARVVIDDHCDGCGPEAKGRSGVAFGADKPVLCSDCLRQAVDLFRLPVGNLKVTMRFKHPVCISCGEPRGDTESWLCRKCEVEQAIRSEDETS